MALTYRYAEANERLEQTDRALLNCRNRRIELEAYLGALESTGNMLTEFDPLLWNAMVDAVTIQMGGVMVFRLKDGQVSNC